MHCNREGRQVGRPEKLKIAATGARAGGEKKTRRRSGRTPPRGIVSTFRGRKSSAVPAVLERESSAVLERWNARNDRKGTALPLERDRTAGLRNGSQNYGFPFRLPPERSRNYDPGPGTGRNAAWNGTERERRTARPSHLGTTTTATNTAPPTPPTPPPPAKGLTQPGIEPGPGPYVLVRVRLWQGPILPLDY